MMHGRKAVIAERQVVKMHCHLRVGSAGDEESD
jgi:hypothetical protein